VENGNERSEVVILTESVTLSLHDLSTGSGFSIEELRELVAYGALAPAAEAGGDLTFPGACLDRMRRAVRLRRDFELTLSAVSLVLAYLERIEELEARLRQLECRLPR
jgi:chaperone modulatory protein CbpM